MSTQARKTLKRQFRKAFEERGFVARRPSLLVGAKAHILTVVSLEFNSRTKMLDVSVGLRLRPEGDEPKKPVECDLWGPIEFLGGLERYPVLEYLQGEETSESDIIADKLVENLTKRTGKSIEDFTAAYQSGGFSGWLVRKHISAEFGSKRGRSEQSHELG